MTAPAALLDRWLTDPRWNDMSSLYAAISDDLERVEGQLADWARAENPLTAEVSRYVLQKRGKRLRPALVLLTSRLFPDRSDEDIFLASLVELIHTASLIHDDIIDNAETRRGTESVHARWGANITVLLGDYLYIKSIGLSLGSRHDRIIRLLADVSSRMIQGELDECALGGDLGISEAQYLDIIENKTAVLFAACCRIGAILGHAAPEEEHRMVEYGRNLGLSFQIVDDLLDFTGDEYEMGKPVLSDLGEGRVTLPLIHALRGDGRLLRERVAAFIGRKDVDRDDKKKLLEALSASGALEYAGALARRYSDAALGFLSGFPESVSRETLAGLAGFVLVRNR